MVKVNIEGASSYLKLDTKIVKILKMVAKGKDFTTLSDFIQTLCIMEFDNWEELDNTIEFFTSVENKFPSLKVEKPKVTSNRKTKAPVKKVEPNKAKEKKKPIAKSSNKKTVVTINAKKKKTRVNVDDEFIDKLKEYIDSVDKYTISDIAKKFDVSYSTARRYTMHIDPDRNKLLDMSNRQNKNVKRFIDYITLNNDQQERQNKLNEYIDQFSAEQFTSKTALMSPIYETLKNNYGIVFEQSAKDMMYENNLTPINDYPYPTKNDVIIYYDNIFNIAQSLMLDMYAR